MPKNNCKKILSLGLFLLISLFSFPNISQAADINAAASRTSGVAPLSVHFNADLTASSPTERNFHDLEYSWNFGDPSAGTWGTDNKPKNEDKGPVSAHVYETPGTFTATLTVRDATGIIDTKTFEITVTDPDIVFAGTKTTCISTDNDWVGCPAGANQIANDDLSVMATYTDAGKRVMLHRGSAWTLGADIVFPSNTGPVHIGAYGSCSNPDELEICSNAPSINITGGNQFLSLSYKNDWRLTDISFSASKGVSVVIGGATAVKNNLIFRIKSTGFNSAVTVSNYRTNDSHYNDNNTFVSSKFMDALATVFYVGSEHLSILGNVVQNSDTTHVVRVFHGYQGVITHNYISGSSLLNTAGRHALKLHGPAPIGSPGTDSKVGTLAETGTNGLRNYSQFIVIANNVFGASGPWPVSIGPQNGVCDERISDVLFEKNKVVADYGQNSAVLVTNPTSFEGRYMTVRNNIINGSGSSSDGYIGITIYRRGIEWTPLGNRVYNNTIYNPESLDYHRGIVVGADANDTIIQNNYVSIPNTSGEKTLINDASGNAVISNNVSNNTPYFFDSDNVSPLLRNFSLTSNSTQAIDQGISVPVFDDFAGTCRTGAYDIGAYDYDLGDMIAPSAPANLSVL